MREADLTGANLSGASLRDVDLSGAQLHRATLTGCDLRGSDLSALAPAHAAYFATNEKAFDASLTPWYQTIKRFAFNKPVHRA